MDNLIRITKNITFEDLKSGRKSPIDVYEEQIQRWLFQPLELLAIDKEKNFENGYAMFALELLFFEPHGKYLRGKIKNGGSKQYFQIGSDSFIDFLQKKSLIDTSLLLGREKLIKTFYNVSRCGIYHSMKIEPGLLIDSIHSDKSKVLYNSPLRDIILVSPWNLFNAEKEYFNNYIKELRANNGSDKYKNFYSTFITLFQY